MAILNYRNHRCRNFVFYRRRKSIGCHHVLFELFIPSDQQYVACSNEWLYKRSENHAAINKELVFINVIGAMIQRLR